MRKCRHRAVGLRLMSTKRKTVIHTKALKLQSPVVCMTLHPPKLNTWFCNRCSAKPVLTKTPMKHIFSPTVFKLRTLRLWEVGSLTHSSADSEIKTGSRVWLRSESTLPVSLLSDLPHCRLASTCPPDSRTWSLSAQEIPSLESEPRKNYRMATIRQDYTCNFKRAFPLRNVKHLIHMLLQCIRRSWL